MSSWSEDMKTLPAASVNEVLLLHTKDLCEIQFCRVCSPEPQNLEKESERIYLRLTK